MCWIGEAIDVELGGRVLVALHFARKRLSKASPDAGSGERNQKCPAARQAATDDWSDNVLSVDPTRNRLPDLATRCGYDSRCSAYRRTRSETPAPGSDSSAVAQPVPRPPRRRTNSRPPF